MCTKTNKASADARKLAAKIKKKGGKDLKAVGDNLVDAVWGGKRPLRPNEKVTVLGTEYAGKKVSDKLADLRKELDKKKSTAFIVCKLYMLPASSVDRALICLAMLDEIAWLYNLRGNE